MRGESVALPLKEFELLELLMANAGRVLDPRRADRPHLGTELLRRHQDARRAHQAAAVEARSRLRRVRRGSSPCAASATATSARRSRSDPARRRRSGRRFAVSPWARQEIVADRRERGGASRSSGVGRRWTAAAAPASGACVDVAYCVSRSSTSCGDSRSPRRRRLAARAAPASTGLGPARASAARRLRARRDRSSAIVVERQRGRSGAVFGISVPAEHVGEPHHRGQLNLASAASYSARSRGVPRFGDANMSTTLPSVSMHERRAVRAAELLVEHAVRAGDRAVRPEVAEHREREALLRRPLLLRVAGVARDREHLRLHRVELRQVVAQRAQLAFAHSRERERVEDDHDVLRCRGTTTSVTSLPSWSLSVKSGASWPISTGTGSSSRSPGRAVESTWPDGRSSTAARIARSHAVGGGEVPRRHDFAGAVGVERPRAALRPLSRRAAMSTPAAA